MDTNKMRHWMIGAMIAGIAGYAFGAQLDGPSSEAGAPVAVHAPPATASR